MKHHINVYIFTVTNDSVQCLITEGLPKKISSCKQLCFNYPQQFSFGGSHQTWSYSGNRLIKHKLFVFVTVLVVWGTPANFNGFLVLAALLHGSQEVGVSQTVVLNIGHHLCSA